MTYKPKVNDYVIWERHGLKDEGWTDFDSQTAVNLTKEQCDQVLNNLVQLEGIDFRELKAVRDN